MKTVVTVSFMKSLKKLDRRWWHPAKLWYSFKCWSWKRYSTIRSRHLPHTWTDRVVLLPYTMFEILEQFIEGECSPGHIQWYGEDGHKIKVELPGGHIVEKFVRDEMQDLLDWWNNEYHKRYKQLEEQIWDEYHELDSLHISDFRPDPESPDAEYAVWDPQYETQEAADRAHELLRRVNYFERAADQAMYRRMHRLVKLTPYLWT